MCVRVLMCVRACLLPDTSDGSCEENEGRRDQQPVRLARVLQEVPERGRGARGVPAFPPACPQGWALMTPCGHMLPLHPGHINDEWGPKAKNDKSGTILRTCWSGNSAQCITQPCVISCVCILNLLKKKLANTTVKEWTNVFNVPDVNKTE